MKIIKKMNKNILGIFFLIFIAFAACAGKKKLPKNQSKTDFTYVQMRRTACFGRCPEYNIELYKDGLVRYTGIRYVKDSGVYEKNIGAAKVAELLNDFNQYRVDTCKEGYQVIISDLPGLHYSLKYNGKTKNIKNAAFGPDYLKFLAKNIDEAIQVDKTWKKISATHKPD